MSELRFEITLRHVEPEQFTLEGLAARAGMHPMLLQSFVDYGLLEPTGRAGSQVLFGAVSLARLRVIERLRRDLGINLAGIVVILDLLDRLTALQREAARWRERS